MSITSAKSGATGISLALDNNFMEPIASTLVGAGGVSAVTFNDIPQTYKHLQIRGITRATGAYSTVDGKIQFNGDSAANYAFHGLTTDGGGGTTIYSATADSAGRFARNGMPGNNLTASVYGSYVVDILDYTSLLKFKTVRSLGGYDNNGSGSIVFMSSLWQSTASIFSITLTTDGGSLFQHSRFSLYGVKG